MAKTSKGGTRGGSQISKAGGNIGGKRGTAGTTKKA